jgi:16S rRNA (cytosine1402-N4)-methyltransferase
MGFSHISVLLNESIEGLNIRPDGVYVDCTAGGGGHSLEIAKKLSEDGMLIALDRDPDAVKAASERLLGYNAKVIKRNYSEVDKVMTELGIDGADGILMDLGVSSYQLDTPDRGFSYHYDAPLDMRMSRDGISAYDIVNSWSEQQLAKIIFEYGEEKFSRRIAGNIIQKRENAPVRTTLELAEIIKESVPAAARRNKNPCKKTFQAIRIAVNGEFDHLTKGLECAFECLRPHGRLAVITFHSLEDRIVKQFFAGLTKGCICPPDFPQCVCGKKPKADLVNRKPVTASPEELEANNRSRSAKLRIIERR